MENKYKGRFHRLLKIVLELKTSPRQRPEDLWGALGVSKAQFYQDRNALKEIGFEFEYSKSSQKFIITKEEFLPTLDLTFTERIALVMALRHLSAAGDHLLTFEGFQAARKLATDLPRPFRDALFDDVVLHEGFGCKKEILEKIQTAINRNQRVVLHYRRPHQAELSREKMDPYHIFFRRRALYLEGYSWPEGGVRMYRMNRIEKVDLGEIGFSVLDGYDFGRRYKNAFSAFPGEDTEHVKVKFSRKIRPYIQETLWHHSQKTTVQDDETLIFEVDVAYPREVMWWAFFWGDGAEVLEPGWLRDEAKGIVLKMGALYA